MKEIKTWLVCSTFSISALSLANLF